ncbi:MAG TPA: response regulator [Euryarchaeota archaeon]|nr:transcriptional regulatory protein AfsQ1 [archaeon BMS3Abin16]GBE56513.1 transcriptional regulatory protein AfsQ1 [archaeon BMS3Bbin16]HDH28013.1 response regulator [Euryarchaeota archaeon]
MPKMILIVDDEDDILFILKNVLSKNGYSVREAYSGEECLEIVKKERPDLIFMDIMMPGMDGWETAKTIKDNPKTADIPISMLSVKSDPADQKRSREYAGADHHLTKPVDFSLLLQTAESLISANN